MHWHFRILGKKLRLKCFDGNCAISGTGHQRRLGQDPRANLLGVNPTPRSRPVSLTGVRRRQLERLPGDLTDDIRDRSIRLATQQRLQRRQVRIE